MIRVPINQPPIAGGAAVQASVNASVHADGATFEARISLFEEPKEDIRLLGLMIQDVAIMGDVLRHLPSKSLADYRSSLIVCRGAAERLKQRCTRLLGDGDDVPPNGTRVQRGGTKRPKPER